MVDLIEQCNTLYQKLDADWSVTTDSWNDIVHDSYENKHIKRIKDSLLAYIQGSYGGISVRGKGLVDFLNFIDECGSKLSSLTGEPFNAGNDEKKGNEYIPIDEQMLRYDGRVKDRYRDKRQEEILIHETDDITYSRQHNNNY